jgi:hypothetical protein
MVFEGSGLAEEQLPRFIVVGTRPAAAYIEGILPPILMGFDTQVR